MTVLVIALAACLGLPAFSVSGASAATARAAYSETLHASRVTHNPYQATVVVVAAMNAGIVRLPARAAIPSWMTRASITEAIEPPPPPVSNFNNPQVSPAIVVSYADGGVWACIAHYESGGNWSINTGNGFYGGLQFAAGTWAGFGGLKFAPVPGPGAPFTATPSQQITVAGRVLASQGWGAWPVTSVKCGA